LWLCISLPFRAGFFTGVMLPAGARSVNPAASHPVEYRASSFKRPEP
jgi:hypothetical protein